MNRKKTWSMQGHKYRKIQQKTQFPSIYLSIYLIIDSLDFLAQTIVICHKKMVVDITK